MDLDVRHGRYRSSVCFLQCMSVSPLLFAALAILARIDVSARPRGPALSLAPGRADHEEPFRRLMIVRDR